MRRSALPACLALGLGLGLGLGSPEARADQLQCNDQKVAQAAVEMLPPGSIFIDFCSLCEAKVQVVRVTAAEIVKDCDYEVAVRGELITQTSQAFNDGYVPGQAKFVVPADKAYSGRLDLAYAYVEVKENDFRWIGGQLGLQATVNTASIELPPEVYAKLGPHTMPSAGSAAPVEVAAPAPETAAVQRVFEYFRRGEAGPVLGHLVPCLELELGKRSPRRYECKEKVVGAVKPGTEVFAWTDWLVPRDTKGAAYIQFEKDGKVRLERRVPLKGKPRSPIVPATAGAKLSQVGIYVLRVKLDGRTLAEVSVEVKE